MVLSTYYFLISQSQYISLTVFSGSAKKKEALVAYITFLWQGEILPTYFFEITFYFSLGAFFIN